jgi:hypothetical protein
MKKIIGILCVAVIAVAMFFSANGVNGSSSNTGLASLMTMNTANAQSESPCEFEPRGCPIWNVKITIGYPENQISCETGGSYYCDMIY